MQVPVQGCSILGSGWMMYSKASKCCVTALSARDRISVKTRFQSII